MSSRYSYLGNEVCWQKERKDHQRNVKYLIRKKKCFDMLLLEYSTDNFVIDAHVEKSLLKSQKGFKWEVVCNRKENMNTIIQRYWWHHTFCKRLLWHIKKYVWGKTTDCRSQRLRSLRRRSAAARLLSLRFRIPSAAWMFVFFVCCVLSGRGFCVGLVTRPRESYWLWCVVECDLET